MARRILSPVLFSSKTLKRKKIRQGLTDLHSQIATCCAPECWDSSCNILDLMLVPCSEALSGKDGGVENNAFSAPGNCSQRVCPPGNRSLPSNASPEFNQIFGDTLPLFLSGTMPSRLASVLVFSGK